MMDQQNPKKTKIIKSWMPALMLILLSAVLLLMNTRSREPFFGTVWSYSMEMAFIFPAVLVMMGLLSVFVSNQFIGRHLGEGSGIRGMLLAFLLGTLPTGPLYIAFPLAASLKKKGARTANMVIFLSAWACIKLPQELVELRFLGPRFMAARLVLTIVFVTIMSLAMEALLKKETSARQS